MTKYRKSPDKDLVIIPGAGRVAPGQILEGPQYARFVKLGLLEEIVVDPAVAEKEAAAKKKAEAAAKKAADKAAKAAAKKKADDAAEAEAEAAKLAEEDAAAAEAALNATPPPDSDSGDADNPDSTREIAAVSEEEAEVVVGGVEDPEDETQDAEKAKMEKRAKARRKKRTMNK